MGLRGPCRGAYRVAVLLVLCMTSRSCRDTSDDLRIVKTLDRHFMPCQRLHVLPKTHSIEMACSAVYTILSIGASFVYRTNI